MLDQLVAAQSGADKPTTLGPPHPSGRPDPNRSCCSGKRGQREAHHITKMTIDNGLKVFLNMFKWSAKAAGWTEKQWAALLIPYLVGLALQVVDTIPPENVADCGKVRDGMPFSRS